MNPPAFQFYADDFLSGVLDMSREDRGDYIVLLCWQWSKGSIPEDPVKLSRIVGGNVSVDVLRKFEWSDGQGRNKRMEFEREKQAEYRNKQSKRGQAGAEARWHRHSAGNGTSNGTGIAQAMADASCGHWQNDGSPSPSPSPSPLSTPIVKYSTSVGGAMGEPTTTTTAARRKQLLPDDEWINSLKSEPAYAKTDVAIEVSKCRIWCETNNQQFSRRRIVNWLNRVRTITTNGNRVTSESKQIQEDIKLPFIKVV